MLHLLTLACALSGAAAIFFGGGGGGGGCQCQQQQCQPCGCQQPAPCPPPPVAVCPAPQPVYVQQQSPCGGGGGGASYAIVSRGGGYAQGGGGYAQGGGYSQGGPVAGPSYSSGGAEQTYADGGQQGVENVNVIPETPIQVEPQPTATGTERRARGVPTQLEDKCNSKELYNLILDHVVAGDAVASKRAIHKAASEQITDTIVDVICSEGGFTYIVSTAEHCEAQKDRVICFLYKRP